jgi:hypothetical protein
MPKQDDPARLHHGEKKPFELVMSPSEGVEELEAHFDRWIGPSSRVWHELISDKVHLDVHMVDPTDERPFYNLYTTGMSDRQMTVPDQLPNPEEWRHAELMICLPPDWFSNAVDFTISTNMPNSEYWPIAVLKLLARLPHDYDTWLGFGHTIPNGQPPEPFAEGTALCCAMILPPVTVREQGHQVRLSDGRVVNLWAVVLLYAEEAAKKLAHGAESLFDGFDEHGVNEILIVNRPNVAI